MTTYDEYRAALGAGASAGDLLADTDDIRTLRDAATELTDLEDVTQATLVEWLDGREHALRALGLTVGLGKERLKSHIRSWTGASSIKAAAKNHAVDVVARLDEDFGLTARLSVDRHADFTFSDIVVARAGTRSTAARAAASGRSLEDRLEEVAQRLGLDYVTRGKFTGSGGRTAPFDLAILRDDAPVIVVAAKNFNSTGSKLTDAVREVQQMADVRLPTQFVFAAVDGMGWLGREADLRRIHDLYRSRLIDGLYTASMLDRFSEDLTAAVRRLGM